jgi:hypothetical protein
MKTFSARLTAVILGLFCLSTVASAQIQITQIVTTDETCPGMCDGTMTIFTSGGTSPIMYDIGLGQQPTNVFTGLCPGTYNITVTDALPSTDTDVSFITGAPLMTSSVAQQFDATCFGNCDGGALVFTTGGIPPYVMTGPFPGSPLTYTSAATLGGLCAGTGTYTITDMNGCTDFVIISINEPPQLTVSASVVSDPSAPSACDGIVTSTSSGGTSPHTYMWIDCATGNPVGTAPTVNGLCAGNYGVLVTDANGCTAMSSCVTLTDPAACLTSVISGTDVNCFGDCDGSIFINTTGGTLPYILYHPLTGNPITYTSATVISGLCAGTYTLLIEDAGSCQDFGVVTINEPPAINSAATVISDPSSPTACDGSAVGTATGGTPPYTYNWMDCSTGNLLNILSTTATGLCAGDYAMITTDDNGCVDTSNCVTLIGAGCNLVSTYSTTMVTCNGDCDGSIFISTNSGTPPYIVNDPVSGAPTSYTSVVTFGNVCAGVYTLQIVDAASCVETIVVTIAEPTAIFTNVTVVSDPTAPSACDGVVTGQATGGTSPYNYLWIDCATGNPVGTAPTVNGLCAGDYAMITYDMNGCVDTSNCITLTDPVGCLTTTTSVTNVSCFGDCDGTIFISTTGGTLPYIVYHPLTGNPITYTSVTGINGLCAGTYTLQITDAGTCQDFAVVTISEPPAITSAATITSNPSSPTACDGSAVGTATGGTGAYSYDWVDCATGSLLGINSSTATGLCAGNYAMITTDANGCVDTSNCVTLVGTGCNMVSTTQVTNVSCNGDCDGTILLMTTGGTMPYIVNHPVTGAPTTYTSAMPFSNICAGVYTLQIVDAASCIETIVVTVTEPTAIFTNVTVVSDPTAPSACDGVVTGQATGGTPTYNYMWIDCATGNPVGTSPTVTGLCAGDYAMITYDMNGCVDTSNCITLTDPAGCLTTTTSVTDVSCFGDCNGSIFINTTGGTLPYIVFHPQTGNPITYTSATVISGLCAGTYTLQITDAGTCQDFAIVTVSEPPAINSAATVINDPSSPTACDGNAVGTSTGGTPGYSYDWIDCTTGNLLGINSPTASGLCAGNYAMITTDANGCVDTSNCVTLVGTGCNMVSTTQVTNVSCNGDCDGTILLMTTGGTMPYIVNHPVTGAPTTYTSAMQFGNICAGIYTLQIVDAASCIETIVVTVTEPTAIFTNVTVVSDPTAPSACDGVVTGQATGGTPTYNYMWIDCATGNPVGTSPTVTGLCAGDYAMITYDMNGCVDTSNCITLTDPPSGISDHENAFSFNVYPNPTNGNVFISINTEEVLTLQLVDVIGKVVEEHTLSGTGELVETINMEALGLNTGIYFLQLRSTTSQQTTKIIYTK